MSNNIFKNFNGTIGYLIFKKILIAYVLIAAFLTSYQIYSELNSSEKEIHKDYLHIKNHYNKKLSKAIKEEKIEDINTYLNDMLIERSEISGIALTSKRNKLISLAGTIDESLRANTLYENITNKYDFSPEKLMGFDYFITYENKIIAKLTLFVTKKEVYSYAQESIFLILFNILISIIVFWALTVYMTNKYLTIPLKKLINGIKKFEEHEDERVAINLKLKNLKELSILADSVNKMSSKISEDIINLKQLTMIQTQQKKALVEANKTKDDFLANISHELKTPLNSINLISSIMVKNKKGVLDEKDIKNLKIINNCGNDLLHLINDILDLSKLEAGKLKLMYELVDIKFTIESLAKMFQPQLKEKDLNFEFKCDESIEKIYTDENRLSQIIKNLLSNSIKFVENGSIRLYIKDNNETVKIIISDDGIGIAEDKLEHIFERFKQADGSTTRKYGGTGLGLAICKDLVTLFEGTINIESEINVGTTVTIEIPKNLNKVENKDDTIQETKAPLDILEHDFLFEEISDIANEKEEEKANLLILNNDPISYMNLIIELNKIYKTQQTKDFKELVKKLAEQKFDLVIIDNDILKDINTKKVADLNEKLILVLREDDNLSEELKNRVNATITKPFNKETSLEKIKNIMD